MSSFITKIFFAAALLAALLVIPLLASSGQHKTEDSVLNGENNNLYDYVSLMQTEKYNVKCDGNDITVSDDAGNEIHRIQGGMHALPENECNLVKSGFTIEKEELEKLLEAYTS